MTNKKRIAFIDLARAYAILMMVQGHTIQSLIADQHRNSNFLYQIWEVNRGFTAPIFLLMSGCIFMFLLIKAQKPTGNIRAKKGVHRAGFLLFIAYLLQFNPGIFKGFPPLNLEEYGFVITVHILHCIALGLLVLIGIYYISRLIKIDSLWLLSLGILLILFIYPFIIQIEFDNYMPRILGNYFTSRYKSLFPIIPWHLFLLVGAILGNILTKFPQLHMKKQFAFSLIAGGILLGLTANPIFGFFNSIITDSKIISFYASNDLHFKLFIAFAIIGVFSLLCQYLSKIPNWLIIVGQNTLWIYAIHIFVVYDVFISKSIFSPFRHSLTFADSVLAACIAEVMVLTILFALRYLLKKYAFRFGPK